MRLNDAIFSILFPMKSHNPTSPARRQLQTIEFGKYLTGVRPQRALTRGRRRAVGRNAYGRITTRHKGSGAKRRWREVDFRFDKIDIPARVEAIEYDPNRSGFLALILFADGERRYMLAPQGLLRDARVLISERAPVEIGNRTLLRNIPIGTVVHNVELVRGKGAALARAAGNGAMVIAQEETFTHLELPSKEVRMVHSGNWASIGAVSNPEHGHMVVGKAGRARRMGIRPTVRGSAMNPVDHPHGGGEGRALIGRRRGPATPWGKPARGVKTRNKKKHSSKYILRRRRK